MGGSSSGSQAVIGSALGSTIDPIGGPLLGGLAGHKRGRRAQGPATVTLANNWNSTAPAQNLALKGPVGPWGSRVGAMGGGKPTVGAARGPAGPPAATNLNPSPNASSGALTPASIPGGVQLGSGAIAQPQMMQRKGGLK